MDLQLTKLPSTATTVVLGWTPPAGCMGYVYYVNDKRVSNTWDGTVNRVKFHKIEGAVYKVVALGNLAEGKYPPSVPTNSEAYSADPYNTGVYSH